MSEAPTKRKSTAWEAGLSLEEQDRVFGWCDAVGYQQAAERVQAELGRKTSAAAMHAWYGSYPARRAFRNAGDFAAHFKSIIQETPALGLNPEQVDATAQVLFEAEAMRQMDRKAWLDLKVARQNDVRLEQNAERTRQGAEALRQNLFRLQRETIGILLDDLKRERANAIAAGTAPTEEKKEALGQLIFGEDWNIKL